MGKAIKCYSNLDNDNLDKFIDSKNIYFSYFDANNQEVMLEKQVDNTEFVISPKNPNWSCSIFGLRVKIEYVMHNLNSLYGDNYYTGIAEDDSILGFTIMYYSTGSKVCNYIKDCFDISNKEGEQVFSFIIDFEAKTYINEIDICPLIILKRASKKILHLSYNKEQGSILGVLEPFTVVVTGNGSQFPIKEFNDPNDKLWYVDMNFDDIATSLFSECFCLKLNNAHKDFIKYLQPDSKSYCPRLISEICKSALILFFSRVIQEVGSDIPKDYNPRSIAEYMDYLHTTYKVNFGSIPEMQETITAFFDEEIKL